MPMIRQQPGPTAKFAPKLVGASSDILIGTLKKNADDMLVVQLRTHHHSQYVDVRHFYRNDRHTGKWLPSTKGVAFRPGLLKQFIQLLVAADERAAAGRLEDYGCR